MTRADMHSDVHGTKRPDIRVPYESWAANPVNRLFDDFQRSKG